MQPDSNRQWFVYYNEKEMGPFFEREVLQKLEAKEFDASAYVFTEGMTDWALVQDTSVLISTTSSSNGSPISMSSKSNTVPLESGNEANSSGFEEELPPHLSNVHIISGSNSGASLREVSPTPGAQQNAAPASLSADFARDEASRPGFGNEGTGEHSRNTQNSAVRRSVTAVTDTAKPAAKKEKRSFASFFSRKKKEPAPKPTPKGNTQSGVAQVSGGKTNPGVPISRGQTASGVQFTGGKTNSGVAQASAEKTNSGVAPAKPAAAALKKKRPSPVLVTTLVVLIVGGGLYYLVSSGMEIPYLSKFLRGGASKVDLPPDAANENAEPPAEMAEGIDETPAPSASPKAAAGSTAAAPTGAPTTGNLAAGPKAVPVTGGAVEGLLTYRETTDANSKPFKLATPLGDKFPVIVGAVSKLLDVQQVAVAVFPENDRNLMLIPQIWFLKAPVVSGLFSVGPLSLDGKAIPPGRYRVYVQWGEKFLGGETLDIGTWPSPQEVTRMQADFGKDREKVAQAERDAYDMKLREISNAFGQLKNKAVVAGKGPRGRKEWDSFKRPWLQNLNKAISDQKAVSSGPMFYDEAQELLGRYLTQLKKLYESYELLSSGGQKLLSHTRPGVTVGKQMAEILKTQNDISQVSKGLPNKPLQAFQLDPKRIELNLTAFALSDQIKK